MGQITLLNLNELANGRVPAISPALGGSLAEAAGVCLESQGHTPGVMLQVSSEGDSNYLLDWLPISEQALRAWFEPDEATEFGAVAIAIALAREQTGFEVIRRSRNGSGFDYWLGDRISQGFQNMAGLEVSGIRQGGDSIVSTRVEAKLRQSRRSHLPVYVIVVEFSRPLARVRKDERPERVA